MQHAITADETKHTLLYVHSAVQCTDSDNKFHLCRNWIFSALHCWANRRKKLGLL